MDSAVSTIRSLFVNNLVEVTNDIGGVIGYRLELDEDDTQSMGRAIDQLDAQAESE